MTAEICTKLAQSYQLHKSQNLAHIWEVLCSCMVGFFFCTSQVISFKGTLSCLLHKEKPIWHSFKIIFNHFHGVLYLVKKKKKWLGKGQDPFSAMDRKRHVTQALLSAIYSIKFTHIVPNSFLFHCQCLIFTSISSLAIFFFCCHVQCITTVPGFQKYRKPQKNINWGKLISVSLVTKIHLHMKFLIPSGEKFASFINLMQ